MFLIIFKKDSSDYYDVLGIYDIGDNSEQEIKDYVDEIKYEWSESESDEFLSVVLDEKLEERGCKSVPFEITLV